MTIAWSVERRTETRLLLRWSESGGPVVAPPTRTGFGSRLIERSLARELAGDVQLLFAPAGVVCTIEVPIPAPTPLERRTRTLPPQNAASLPLSA